MSAPVYTAADKLKSVEREVRYRKHVYPRLAQQGTMSDILVKHEIGIFEQIADDYREQVQRRMML